MPYEYEASISSLRRRAQLVVGAGIYRQLFGRYTMYLSRYGWRNYRQHQQWREHILYPREHPAWLCLPCGRTSSKPALIGAWWWVECVSPWCREESSVDYMGPAQVSNVETTGSKEEWFIPAIRQILQLRFWIRRWCRYHPFVSPDLMCQRADKTKYRSDYRWMFCPGQQWHTGTTHLEGSKNYSPNGKLGWDGSPGSPGPSAGSCLWAF